MNVSSVKNLNGETFSAVQDADLTTVVQTNSGNWNDISAYQNASATYMPSGQFISARGLDQIIRGKSSTSRCIGFKIPDSTTLDTPAVYLQGQFGSAYYKENELKLNRSNMTIAFNIGGGGPKISAGGTGTTAPSYLYLYNSANSATLSQTGLLLSANDTTSGLVNIPSISAWNDTTSSYQNASSTYLTALNIPESADWEDTTDVVQTNSASWGAGSTPTYDYTDGLISAIDTSGLFAQGLLSGSKIGRNISWYGGDGVLDSAQMWLNPDQTHFAITSGIFSPLTYATGATITYGSSGFPAPNNGQIFGGFFKGNEWYVSNAIAGQAIRGETHANRGVHLSGVTTDGYSFDLSVNCVSGNNSLGEWRYGPAEDTLLRSVSSNEVSTYVQTNSAGIDETVNSVNTNSGAWGGSSLPISAGPGIKVNMVNNTLVFSNDETVLFESTSTAGTTLTTASPITLAEDYSNFNRMRIEYRIWPDQSFKFVLEEVPCRNGYFTLSHGYINGPNNPGFYEFLYGLSGNDSKLYYSYGCYNKMGQTGITTVDELNIMGITGINRK